MLLLLSCLRFPYGRHAALMTTGVLDRSATEVILALCGGISEDELYTFKGFHYCPTMSLHDRKQR